MEARCILICFQHTAESSGCGYEPTLKTECENIFLRCEEVIGTMKVDASHIIGGLHHIPGSLPKLDIPDATFIKSISAFYLENIK